MTKKVYRTNLKQVEGVKIVCKKCKASFVIPIAASTPPKQCFSCNRDLPWQDINRVIKGIEAVVNAGNNFDFDAFIETEED